MLHSISWMKVGPASSLMISRRSTRNISRAKPLPRRVGALFFHGPPSRLTHNFTRWVCKQPSRWVQLGRLPWFVVKATVRASRKIG